MTKINGKFVIQSTDAPEPIRRLSVDMNAACENFLRDRGLSNAAGFNFATQKRSAQTSNCQLRTSIPNGGEK